MSPKPISAQRSLHIAKKKYACTHMLRSACAHALSSPYALTCPHAPVTASIVLFANTLEELILSMRKHTCIHAGALCTLYAQSKACTGGLYVDHPGCCSVAQVGTGSCCLTLSCLITVRCCPQICSNASCCALGTDLRGIRRIIFLLAMTLLALSPPPGADVESQP